MMRKEKVITVMSFILFLIIGINFLSCANASQISQKNKIIVDINGNGDYTSIQEAVNFAPSGSKIYVKSGSYREVINIKKPVEIIGENKQSTLINPISEKNKYAIRLGAPGIILRSLSITNGAPGLYASGVRISSDKAGIYNCDFYDNPVGVVVWTSENIIENCIFSNCKDEGIALLGSKYSNCKNNKITNCVFYDNCDGIELQYSSSNIISNCKIYNNTHTGIDAIASSNDNNLIQNCEIYSNEVHGIYLSSSSNNKIIDCLILENEDGNIIMNKKSENNLIITITKKDASNINSLKLNEKITNNNIIQKIQERFSNFHFFKIKELFRINNF